MLLQNSHVSRPDYLMLYLELVKMYSEAQHEAAEAEEAAAKTPWSVANKMQSSVAGRSPKNVKTTPQSHDFFGHSRLLLNVTHTISS